MWTIILLIRSLRIKINVTVDWHKVHNCWNEIKCISMLLTLSWAFLYFISMKLHPISALWEYWYFWQRRETKDEGLHFVPNGKCLVLVCKIAGNIITARPKGRNFVVYSCWSSSRFLFIFTQIILAIYLVRFMYTGICCLKFSFIVHC